MLSKHDVKLYKTNFRHFDLSDKFKKESIKKMYKKLSYFIAKQDFKNAVIAFNVLSSLLKLGLLEEQNPSATLTHLVPAEFIANPNTSYFFAFLYEMLNHQRKALVLDKNSISVENVKKLVLITCFLENIEFGLSIHSPLIPNRKSTLSTKLKQELAVIDDFFLNLREMTKSPTFTCERFLPQWDSFYVESFGNLFDDIQDKRYLQYVLNNIEYFLSICKAESKPVYFYLGCGKKEEIISELRKYLPENSLTEQQVNLEFDRLDKNPGRTFNQECAQIQAKTLLMGGTYAFGCVITSSSRLGKNIFMKNKELACFPDKVYPNYRRIKHYKPYLHENVVILPEITEGFNINSEIEDVRGMPYFRKYPSFAEVPSVFCEYFLELELCKSQALSKRPLEEQIQFINEGKARTYLPNPFLDYSDIYGRIATFSSNTKARLKKRSYQALAWQEKTGTILSDLHKSSRTHRSMVASFFNAPEKKQESRVNEEPPTKKLKLDSPQALTQQVNNGFRGME